MVNPRALRVTYVGVASFINQLVHIKHFSRFALLHTANVTVERETNAQQVHHHTAQDTTRITPQTTTRRTTSPGDGAYHTRVAGV